MFLRHEKATDYKWALEYLRTIIVVHSIEEPLSIITDRELALIRYLKLQFPSTRHLLCRWHVNMNVLTKTKRWFPVLVIVSSRVVQHP
jgi:hypothetical protein